MLQMTSCAAAAAGASMIFVNARTNLSSIPLLPVVSSALRARLSEKPRLLLHSRDFPLSLLGFPLQRSRRHLGTISVQNVRRLGRPVRSLRQEPSSTVESGEESDVNGSGGVSLQLEEKWEELPESWRWDRSTGELVAYGLLLAAVPIVPVLPRFEWTGAFYFLFLAVWSVYVGSHRSLGKKPPRKMSLNQGLAVPVFCSASLFGFYCLLRFFPNLDIRTFISGYLGVAGAVAVANNLVEPLRRLLPADSSFISWKFQLPKSLAQGDDGSPVNVNVVLADLIAVGSGIGASIVSYQAGAPFTLKNLIAVCIVTELLQLLSLGSVTTAAAMLSGLLLYDVFWVFGSSHVFGDNVMVTVATSNAFDGPMKLIFPQFKETALNPYSILGLGDVAAPGLLIALMLRFDRSRVKDSSSSLVDDDGDSLEGTSSPDKTYFVTCLASYIFGLTLTVVANTISGAAQPALLYLVPSLLAGVFLTAAFRSETPLLLSYKDEPSRPQE